MPLIFGNADVSLRKFSLNKFVAMGEKATADDFVMTVYEFPDMEFLIQAAQMPPIKREMVEIVGPHGIQVQQQGKIINAGELPITFIETVHGDALGMLREWVRDKLYLTVSIGLTSEAEPVGSQNASVTLEGCWLESEAIELSVDDNTPLKPTGTLHYNWAGWYESGQTVSWG